MLQTTIHFGEHEPLWIIDDRSPPVMGGPLGKLQLAHYDYIVPRLMQSANAIIVQNYQHEKFLMNRFNCSFPKFIHCGGGVDESRFFSNSSNASNDEITIVYAGSLVRERGILQLIDACKFSVDSGLRIRLVTLGRGNLSDKLFKLSSDYDWFEHRGFVSTEEYENLLSEAHIGVVPHPDKLAWRICSPLKLKEYAASGLVVIATDLPSHRELGARNWLKLIPPNEFNVNFRNVIKDLIVSKSLDELSKSAITDSEHFSWKNETEPIFDWINSNVRI